MKYWTIAFPGEFGQHVEETWSEDQIIKCYWTYWYTKMVKAGKGDMATTERCIEDWCTVHWAAESKDQWGNK